MNYNTASYIIYSIITIYIIVIVGWRCYKNGYYYVQSIFMEEKMTRSINNILLLGYYLTNIGYVITIISTWEKIENEYQMINELSFKIAGIVFLLAIMHYMNIGVLALCRKTSIRKNNIN